MSPPSSLIINSPYEAPGQHWQQDRDGSLSLVVARRPAGYEIFDARHNTRRTESLDLVNSIRGRVDAWREAAYPGVTSVTRRLLEHWHDRSARDLPFYFCQLEAAETLIWLVEASSEFKQGNSSPPTSWKRATWWMPTSKTITWDFRCTTYGMVPGDVLSLISWSD